MMPVNLKNSFKISLILVLSVPALAQAPYKYFAVDDEFYQSAQEAINNGDYEKALSLAQEQVNSSRSDSLQNTEALLISGIALQKLGYYFGSTLLFADILKTKVGTDVAIEALRGLEENVRVAPVDEPFIYGELINDIEFGSLPPNLQDFVSFQEGIFNLQNGFSKWSENDFKKITLDSYWDFKMKYLIALGDVAKSRITPATEKFSAIANHTAAPPDIKIEATHQLGRLVFEKADFEKAYKIFREVSLNPREKGLILIERAWSKYYLKDYSKALGLLAALEAPIFDTSRSPEPYILKMLIYKELCYYDAAFEVLKEFKRRFGASLRAIYRRKDLKKDPMIVSLSVLDRRLGKWVDLLNSVKDERSRMSDAGFSSYSFYGLLKSKYNYKIKEIYERLDWLLEDKSREIAEQLLDWHEQMNFLDYQTRMDSLRITKSGNENRYKSGEIPHLSFEKIYWTKTEEFWLDEIESYRVFVESQCGGENQ